MVGMVHIMKMLHGKHCMGLKGSRLHFKELFNQSPIADNL